MNRRVLIKGLLYFGFISSLSKAENNSQDNKINLVKLLPSIFSLNNSLDSFTRYKISFFFHLKNIKVFYKDESGDLNVLQHDIFFEKTTFYSASGNMIDIYVYPRTPANIYDIKKQLVRVVSDIYMGEIESSSSYVEYQSCDLSKCRKFISPEYFGAIGDGIVDDTKAITKAIESGYSILFLARYLISSSISPVDNQKLIGVNNAEIIISKPNVSLIKTKNVSNVVVKGLILSSQPMLSKPYNGSCIESENSSEWVITNNVFLGYGASAIFCRNSIGMIIGNNKFSGIKNAAGDVTFWGSSRQNKIINNFMRSGSDSAIIIQTILNGDICIDNLIQDNNISNCTRYGIVVYNNLSSKKGVLQNTKVIGNKIDNILGEVKNPSVCDTRTYGAGIYVLSAENTTIQNNVISKCNLLTNSSTLAPGCIGLNATSDAIISDNVISGGAYYGIFVGDALQQGRGQKAKSLYFKPDGNVHVCRNKITNCERDGIYVINKHNVNLDNNFLANNRGCGIATAVSINNDYDSLHNITITKNSSCNNELDGINLSNTCCAVVSGGIYSNNLRCGIGLSSFGTAVSLLECTGNKIGISISNKGTKSHVTNCTLISNDVGILATIPYEENACVFSKNKLSRKISL